MTNTKCTIDCAKYNVKWNIEFWRKWNAINADFTTTHSPTRPLKRDSDACGGGSLKCPPFLRRTLNER